eukprot:scaffold5019_cov131-Skeletonema_dohrnii-CCMP3373.AAC.1
MNEKQQQQQQQHHYHQTFPFKLYEMLEYARDNWKHKDFLRERPDLLKEIVRIEIKSKSNSAMKQVQQYQGDGLRSAGSKRTAEVKGKRVKIEVERIVSPPSHSQAQADSNPTQLSYDYDNCSADASAAVIALQALRYLHATQSQGSVFQYCSANVKHDLQSHNQDSFSMLSSVQMFSDSDETTTTTATTTTTTTQTQVVSTQQKAVVIVNTTHATHRSSDVNTTRVQIQPFNDDELMHLADIFEKDSPSHDDDLRSILSLDRESTVEDFMFMFAE